MKRRVTLVVLIGVLAGCTTGRGAQPPSVEPGEPGQLTIFAAASLKNALEQAKIAYAAAHSATDLAISTDSSAALATQIEQGAPADVFLSADTTNAQRLIDRGLADGDPIVFAANELTIITPTDNPGGLTGPFDLARDGIRVVAAGDEVPIARYATELVENLAREPGAPPDFAARYAANVVSEEDNVAAVRTRIELGEGDAAIVYVTDAAASDQVAVIEVPDSASVRPSYAGVVVEASRNDSAARAFLDWLRGPDGQGILAELGFLPAAP